MCAARQSKQPRRGPGVWFSGSLDAARAVVIPVRNNRHDPNSALACGRELHRNRDLSSAKDAPPVQPELHLIGRNPRPEDQPTGASAERHELSRNHSRKGTRLAAFACAVREHHLPSERPPTQSISRNSRSGRWQPRLSLDRARLTPALTCTGALGCHDLLAEDRRWQTDVRSTSVEITSARPRCQVQRLVMPRHVIARSRRSRRNAADELQ
jgi:hypothetical protein